jgi:uroporphyrinogen decarboxylase
MCSSQKFAWIQNCLDGEAIEHIPRALWRHFPHEEYDTEKFIAAVVKFHQDYPQDLIKITPRSSFIIRDFGIFDEFIENKLGVPTYLNKIVHNPEDWYKLTPRDPQQGYLKQQADCLEQIVTRLNPKVPVIHTIFSPISQGKNLCGLTSLIDHWQNHHRALMYGLEVLAESTRQFIKTIEPWIDGLFYVIQECGVNELTRPSYINSCRHLDEFILSSCEKQIHMLHLHGKIVDFKNYCSYPVTFLHWDEQASGISLAEGKDYFPGIVSGGLSWPVEGWSDVNQLRKVSQEAVERIGRDRLLLSAGCVIPFLTEPKQLQEFSLMSI